MLPDYNNNTVKFLCICGVLFVAILTQAQTASDVLNTATPVHYFPVGDPQRITLSGFQPVAIKLSGYDANGESLTFEIVTQPLHGSVTQFDGTTGQLTYGPQAQFSGIDSFSFVVEDATVQSEPVNVTILYPPDFSLAVASGNPSSITVAAGQTATYNLEIDPSRFVGQIGLSCSTIAPASTCTANPASVSITGNSVGFSAAVSTTGNSSATSIISVIPLRTLVEFGLLFVAVILLLHLSRPHMASRLVLGVASLLLVLTIASCGGGNSSQAKGSVQGTPSGSYLVTISGMSNGVTRSATVTLIVK